MSRNLPDRISPIPAVEPSPLSGLLRLGQPDEMLSFTCNVCGESNRVRMQDLEREISSCLRCKSTVRFRSIIRMVATELFGENLDLPDFPVRRDLTGLGLSDWPGYALPLAQKLNYTNTSYVREPRLDIMAIDPALEGTCNFVISGDVFEHVAPPVSVAFENARKLLKPDGVLFLTVPYRKDGYTLEHYPDLHDYHLEESDSRCILRNVTREGVEQVFDNLVFHGQGRSLEMRVFSEASLMQDLINAGFGRIETQASPDLAHGIYWNIDRSLPLSARIS